MIDMQIPSDGDVTMCDVCEARVLPYITSQYPTVIDVLPISNMKSLVTVDLSGSTIDLMTLWRRWRLVLILFII